MPKTPTRLLIDPLGDVVRLAVAEGYELARTSQSNAKDKPQALEEAFEALGASTFDEIVLVNGPGNFTSLRVALGFARGLGLGMRIPTRGIGVFDVDYALMKTPPSDTTLYRDARGGRYYEARFDEGALSEIILVREIAGDGYSYEKIEGAIHLLADETERLEALARLAQDGAGTIPASANYVRPPDAALPSEPPLVILDD